MIVLLCDCVVDRTKKTLFLLLLWLYYAVCDMWNVTNLKSLPNSINTIPIK